MLLKKHFPRASNWEFLVKVIREQSRPFKVEASRTCGRFSRVSSQISPSSRQFEQQKRNNKRHYGFQMGSLHLHSLKLFNSASLPAFYSRVGRLTEV